MAMKKRKSIRAVEGRNVVVGLRRIRKIGASYYVALPRDFLERHELKEGDELPYIGNRVLRFIPVRKEEKE